MCEKIKIVSGTVYALTSKPFTDIVLIRTPGKIHFFKCDEKLMDDLLKMQHNDVSVSYIENNKSGVGLIIKINADTKQ